MYFRQLRHVCLEHQLAFGLVYGFGFGCECESIKNKNNFNTFPVRGEWQIPSVCSCKICVNIKHERKFKEYLLGIWIETAAHPFWYQTFRFPCYAHWMTEHICNPICSTANLCPAFQWDHKFINYNPMQNAYLFCVQGSWIFSCAIISRT